MTKMSEYENLREIIVVWSLTLPCNMFGSRSKLLGNWVSTLVQYNTRELG